MAGRMDSTGFTALYSFFDLFSGNPDLQALRQRAEQLPSPKKLVQICRESAPFIAKEICAAGFDDALIQLYQRLFREMEALIAHQGSDRRHSFTIVIPVADRPRHLQSCLQSLLKLCRLFHYGGIRDGRYARVSVIIADDSREGRNIRKNREISRRFNGQGLDSLYFGIDEQLQQIGQLPAAEHDRLSNILGDFDRSTFYHKGASMMRNIVYLKLNRIAQEQQQRLFYFVDSDQEFQVKVQDHDGDREVYAVNYFHELDEIFSKQGVNILTGKVVGDPPVSPAVMAGTFLDDVIAFVGLIAQRQMGDPCLFHNQGERKGYEAAYHDMANLFGFRKASESYVYRCTLSGEHDHAGCLDDFSGKLNNFFYGEHPTRKSYFDCEQSAGDTLAARTIYTGNYIFNAEGLDYFIPFANLKLRMAGPSLGRLIRSEIKGRFISANLPMLHKRTVERSGESEFRPGIESCMDRVDLSGEFERQFFGDVMLFTIERLIEIGFPQQSLCSDLIKQALESVEGEMRQRYAHIQAEVVEKTRLLRRLFFDGNNWWNSAPDLVSAKENFRRFLLNIEANFGEDSESFQRIDSHQNRAQRHAAMIKAISAYADDRHAWKQMLTEQHRS